MSAEAAFRARVAGLPDTGGRIEVRRGDVAEIIIRSPSRRNALSPQMMVALRDAAAAVTGARALILHGEGESFCAGGDLGAIRAHLTGPGLGAELQAFMGDTLDALEAAAPLRTAVVTGPALGGGAELLTACTWVIASPEATVGWVQARMGLCPGFGSGQRLVARVGERRALRLLVEARVLPVEEAHRWGLVDEIAADPLSRARERSEAAAALPEAVFRAAVAVVQDGAAAEAGAFAALWGGEAHLAALARTLAGSRR